MDPAILFKSGTRVGDLLYLSTQTAVLVLLLPDYERVGCRPEAAPGLFGDNARFLLGG